MPGYAPDTRMWSHALIFDNYMFITHPASLLLSALHKPRETVFVSQT